MVEVSKKPCNDKKMVVKIGAGGGVGAVILLGGALATAAFASAFIVGMRKRRNSAVSRRVDRQNHPQPKRSEQDEANDEEQEFVFVDKLPSTEATKEAAQSLELDEKTGIDTDRRDVEQNGNGEIKGMNHEEAVEFTEMGNRTEENTELCSEPEESALTVVDRTLDESHNDEMEAEKNCERKISIENESGGRFGDNGETGEVKIEKMKLDLVANTETHQDEGEVTIVDGDVERVCIDRMEVEENPCKEVNYEDKELPVIESPVMEHKNADSNLKDGVLLTEIVGLSEEVISENQEVTKNNDILIEEEHVDEVIQEDEITEGCQEDQVKYVVEEELLEEQTEIYQPDDGILHEKSEEVNDEKSNNEHDKYEEVNEEKSKNENEPENQEHGDCDKKVENLPILLRELISHESIEFEANEEVPESLEVNEKKNLLETIGKEVEDSSGTIDIDTGENTIKEADLSETIDTDTAKASIDLIMETSEKEKGETEIIVDYDELDLSDEVEESSVGTGDSSTDSNSEAAVWPTEESIETQQVKLTEQEMEGKTLEDKKLEAENYSNDREITNCEIKGEKDSKKASGISVKDDSISKNTIKKYFAELSMVKDRPENATKRGLLIVMLSVLSSYSCSWLFGCSFVKLALIMFFSIVLSKIHGY